MSGIKLRRTVNSAALPISLELGVQQANGIVVDNYSGYWLQVGSGALFVPPYKLKWADNFDGSTAGGINVRKSQPSLIATNPAAGQDDTVVVTLYEDAVAPSPGVDIANKPVLTTRASFAGLAAGDYPGLSLPIKGGSTFRDFVIVGRNRTAGGVGEFEVRLEDSGPTLGTHAIGGAFFTPDDVTVVSIPLDFIPVFLNPAQTWSVHWLLIDRVGVGNYDISTTIHYVE